MSDVLDLQAVAAADRRAPAIFDGDSVLDYHALLERTREAPSPLVRACAGLDTVLQVHRALRHRRPYAPLPPDAAVELERSRMGVLRALPLSADAAALIATSGSTGPPRLVELSRRALLAHVAAANARLDLRADDRWLLSLPLDHTGGLAIVLRALAARAAIIVGAAPPLSRGFAAWLEVELTRRRATRLSLVPAQLAALVDARVVAPGSLRSVLIGGQALPAALARRAGELGWPLVRSYGLTETCGMCAVAGPAGSDDAELRALSGTSFRVRAGLLEIASEALASRVHGAPDALRDGWLRTRDRARLVGAGLRVLGRADDVIVSGGRKIDPRPIEEALAALAEVRDSVVVGIPDARYGALACALIVPAQGDRRVLARVDASLRERLPRGERPRHLQLVDELPRLPNGKIDRRAARLAAVQLLSSAVST